jgi:hypothetical protein
MESVVVDSLPAHFINNILNNSSTCQKNLLNHSNNLFFWINNLSDFRLFDLGTLSLTKRYRKRSWGQRAGLDLHCTKIAPILDI